MAIIILLSHAPKSQGRDLCPLDNRCCLNRLVQRYRDVPLGRLQTNSPSLARVLSKLQNSLTPKKTP